MTENDPKFWRPVRGYRAKLADTTQCRYMEVLKYPGDPGLQTREGAVSEVSLESWLAKDLTLESGSELVNPVAGLRLLFGKCEWSEEDKPFQLPITQVSFDLLTKEWGIPSLFLKFIGGFNTRAHKFSAYLGNGHDAKVFIFSVPFWRPIFFQIAVSYNKRTNITSAFLLYRKGGRLWPLLEEQLQAHQHWCDQPVMIPLLLTENVIETCHLKLGYSDQDLNDLEEKIGQHEYLNRPRGDPLKMDFEATTRKINSTGNRVALNAARLQSYTQILEKLTEFKDDTFQGRSCGAEGLEVQVSGSEVDDKLAYLLDTCRILLIQAEYEEKRIAGLTQAVYQFMAQKDAKVNIRLAEISADISQATMQDSKVMKELATESKKDSSAMKTISLLGMVFLPGTFIAAIFAMPTFNWDGDGAPIVKSGFRYYWAVTVPVTIFVLLVWALARLLPWKSWAERLIVHRGNLPS